MVAPSSASPPKQHHQHQKPPSPTKPSDSYHYQPYEHIEEAPPPQPQVLLLPPHQLSQQQPPKSLSDESSESDMDSLRSYHPPAKVIDVPSATRLAKRLYYLDGFKKTDVSRHLSRNNEFNQARQSSAGLYIRLQS